MATNKELNLKLEALEQKLNALGELGPNLTRLQELLGREDEIKQKGEEALATAARLGEIRTDVDQLHPQVTRVTEDLQRVEASSRDLATQQQEAFTNAETDRSTAYSQLLADKAKELDTTIEGLKESTGSAVDEIKKAAEGDRTTAEEAKTRIEKILGIVSEEALTGEYSKNANRDRGVADIWSVVTSIAILVAVTATVLAASAATKASSTWRELVAKIALAVSLGALAGYAARQSAEHRKAQRHSEEMASQLAALKPYLADISNEEKSYEILSGIAPRLFGMQLEKSESQERLKLDKSEDPLIAGQLIALLNEAFKRMK